MKNRLFLLIILVLTLAVTADAETSVRADDVPLPRRSRPRPKTTRDIPHIQIEVKPVREVNKELYRRVYSIPGIKNLPAIMSLPGARGMWLSKKIPIVRPELIHKRREYGHIHPDGSLHLSLPPTRAREAVNTGWATKHPYARQRKEWEGFVMLYTPQSMEELDVTFQLIVDWYNYVTGQNIQATDYYN